MPMKLALAEAWVRVPPVAAAIVSGPSDADIRQALARIVAHPLFVKSIKLQRFLTYVVEETLAGRADRLKAYNIATVALGRPESFDPSQDPIVRVEASRLRRALTACCMRVRISRFSNGVHSKKHPPIRSHRH